MKGQDLRLRRNPKQPSQVDGVVRYVRRRLLWWSINRAPSFGMKPILPGGMAPPLNQEAKRLKLSSHEIRSTFGLEFLSVNLHPKLECFLRFVHCDATMT